jgi:signal transduction histidine kinase
MPAIGLLGKSERVLMLRYGILARLRKQFSLPDSVFEDMAAYLNLIGSPETLDRLSLELESVPGSAEALKLLAETARRPLEPRSAVGKIGGQTVRYDPRGRPSLYQSIVDEVGQMTATQRSLGALGRRLRQTELLIQMGCSILTHLDKDVVLEQIVSVAQHLLSADVSMVVLLDANRQPGEYCVHGVRRQNKNFPDEMRFLLEPIYTREVLQIDNLQALPAGKSLGAAHINVQRVVSVPLIIRGEPEGVLIVGQTAYGPSFDSEDLKLLATFSRQASVALENAHLHDEVLELAQLQERQRIAQDLHDSTVQLLFVVGMEAEGLIAALPEDSSLYHKALRIRRMASRATADLRGAIEALTRGPLRGDAPLSSLLQELVEEFEKLSGIEVTLIAPSQWPELSDRASQAIYRIVRESLANTQKHAQSTAVIVSIVVYQDRLLVSIQDNGTGFSGNARAKMQSDLHFGMRTMHQLAEQAGGYLETMNNEDGGAVVRLTLPLSARSMPV